MGDTDGPGAAGRLALGLGLLLVAAALGLTARRGVVRLGGADVHASRDHVGVSA